jgi:hypothetical protein
MNERIKELIEQAEDYAAEQHDLYTLSAYVERKFLRRSSPL